VTKTTGISILIEFFVCEKFDSNFDLTRKFKSQTSPLAKTVVTEVHTPAEEKREVKVLARILL